MELDGLYTEASEGDDDIEGEEDDYVADVSVDDVVEEIFTPVMLDVKQRRAIQIFVGRGHQKEQFTDECNVAIKSYLTFLLSGIGKMVCLYTRSCFDVQ